jgi:hypothetical protein
MQTPDNQYLNANSEIDSATTQLGQVFAPKYDSVMRRILWSTSLMLTVVHRKTGLTNRFRFRRLL